MQTKVKHLLRLKLVQVVVVQRKANPKVSIGTLRNLLNVVTVTIGQLSCMNQEKQKYGKLNLSVKSKLRPVSLMQRLDEAKLLRKTS